MIEGISEAASENTQKPERDEVITSLMTMLRGEEAVNHEKGEAASDIPVKRKRGRPPTFQHGWSQWDAGSKATTKRGQLEALYARSASRVLFDHRHKHPELIELTGLHKYDDGTEYRDIQSKRNLTVLAELGRLIVRYKNGEEVAVEWAVEILNMEPKPTVKQAMRLLRAWRLGHNKTGSTDALTERLLAAAADYVDSYPSTTGQQICDALEHALNLAGVYYCEDSESESGEGDEQSTGKKRGKK
jgi:hypothetical protein